MASILWFKRDLRATDHPALLQASAAGPVLPLYVFEPAYWQLPDTSGRQFAFLRECVSDLRLQLDRRNLTLTVRVGPVTQILEELRLKYNITQLISHEETGNGWTYARDRAVAEWARAQGVVWTELAQSGVVRRLQGRENWSQSRNGFLRAAVQQTPNSIEGIVAESDPMPNLASMDHCPSRQIGGRTTGAELLDGFLRKRGQTYRRDMSSPSAGARSCSRISPYLALGCISGREAAQTTTQRQKDATGEWAKSLKSFQSRLAWRDHFMQKLEDEPELEHRCLHSAYNGLRGDDATRRAAWEEGQTGLPFVDACMRSLAATGWLNFRMRSMLMAVASYHLWLDWRLTGEHLARQFTDYEPGIHWPQVQMQSGTTGMNKVRIYNPIKQGHDQDPRGEFTRKWVPELSKVPDPFLQEPWRWEGADRLPYPSPIVDVAAAARHARERVHAIRKGKLFRNEAVKLIDKHASRKDTHGHFVNDRAPRKPKADPRQGSFDF